MMVDLAQLSTSGPECGMSGSDGALRLSHDAGSAVTEGAYAPEHGGDLPVYSASELGALAHLYRGEVYRSTIWRTRLDATTNWAVASLGIALSVTFSTREASPVPLLLVGLLVIVFLTFEARRYRYFNVWRARARWMEKHFYAPMLRGEPLLNGDGWQETLAADYMRPHHHISMVTAIGRRLRRSYVWILGIQAVAYYGKIAIHPTPLESTAQLFERAAVGPIAGELVVLAGVTFNLGWIVFAVASLQLDLRRHRGRKSSDAMG
jgi:uncharacterized membrane protein